MVKSDGSTPPSCAAPADVRARYRARAAGAVERPVIEAGAAFLIAVWLSLAVLALFWIRDLLD